MSDEEGTAPQFLEKQTGNQKSRKSLILAQRYAEERKECVFDEAEDSDYERVELLSERKDMIIDGRLSQRLASNLDQQTNGTIPAFETNHNFKMSDAALEKASVINDDVPLEMEEEHPRNVVPEPLSESSEMHPQEFMNSEIDQVSEMEQFRGSNASLEQVEEKKLMLASMPNPFRSNDLNPKKQSSSFKFVEKALPLVTFNQTKQQFVVNPDVVQMMEQVKGPLGVVSVAGMYRTGKSYLLNRVLLNKQRGFGVGPTINPCTKGIWIWGTPLSGMNPNGDQINVIVIDSEGLGGIDEDNNHDMRIFSLALLISSYFVYNSMGQIDENAISNLSLVVNLTNHIQLSVNKDNDIGKVLPSFMWVVRDFSLQLEDEEGNEISQADYLEKALLQQSSDPTDPKTIIRKCLIKFFPNRDCCTLVRPLVEEDKLQRLEEMEIDQLRAEFVEQVMILRRKVLNNCPVKQVYGHAMDGETWVSLLTMYVNAINKGTVPNIESAWVQICRTKAQNQLSNLVDSFERDVAELGFPASQQEFEKNLKEAEKFAVKELQKELQFDPKILKEYLPQLKKHLSKRIQDLTVQNHAACQEFAQQMLLQLFVELDQIKQACLEDPCSQSFQQVEYALRELTNYYDANCFEFAEKHIFLAEHKLTFMFDLLSIQSRHANNQRRLQSDLETQIKERHSSQLREVKEESRSEQVRLENQWKSALQQKSEIEASSQIIQEQLNALKELKQKDDAENLDLMSKLKKQLQETQEEYTTNKEKHEEQAKDIARGQKQALSEFQKEKALLNQKVEYLEATLKEKMDKEKEFVQDWRNQKSGLSQEIKSLQAKHESELKQFVQQLEEERDRSSELDSKLIEKCQKFEQMEEKSKDIEQTLKAQLADAQQAIKDLQESKNQIKQQTMNQLSQKLQQSQQDFNLQKQAIDDLEKRLKDVSEQHQQTGHDAKKQIAMRDQKIEFLDMQLKDLKEQLEESQRQHASMVNALNQRNQNSDDESDAQNKIDLLQKEFNATSEQQLQLIKQLNADVAKLKQDVDIKENQRRKIEVDSERQLLDSRQIIEEADQQKQALQDKIKVLELFKNKVTDDQKLQEKHFQLRLDRELLEKDDQLQTEIKEIHRQHDIQITQLKTFYEIEKEKVELRITEEKERSQRRLATYQEEQEARFNEEFRDKDSEIECLQQQLQEMEQHQQSYGTQAEHEISLKMMQLEGLERQNIDLKERLNKIELTRNNAFDKQLENFEQQRQELNARIEKLMQENLQKDKSVAQISHKLERTSETLERRNAEFDQIQSTVDREKQILFDKCEMTKLALSEIQDEAMQTKLESGREIALLNQQVEFLNRKIEDLQRSNEELQKMFDDKIKVIRQEIFEDAQAQVDRVNSEKELWESKYEQKRKALKDLETTQGKKISDLEKLTSSQQTSLQKLELDKQNKEHALNEEISRLQAQCINSEMLSNQNQLYGSVPAEELLRIKTTLQDTERELQDLQSNFERDKALWEGKVQFLETQKDNYKRDLIESQRKFELTLEQLQKRGSQNKERQETNQQAILKVLETKYKAQIKEMIESQQSSSSEVKERTKAMEAELLQANEKLQFYSKSRYDEVGQLEKKLIESKQKEERLQTELNDFQMENNKKLEDLMQQMQRDKDMLRSKLIELEKKAKDAEQKRTQLLFQVEKERANWQLEEDHLRRKQSELEEFIQSLERSKENLKKENGKLRNDARGNSSSGVQKKSFVFAKGAQHLLNQTSQQMQATGLQTQKSSLILKSGLAEQSVSSQIGGTTQGSSNGISNNSIVTATMSRLKENDQFHELNQSASKLDMKARQSPDIMRNQKSPLIVQRGSQNNLRPYLPPRQPFTTNSISSYNMNTGGNEALSNNGSVTNISQGFKLNLKDRYQSQGHDEQNQQ